MSFPSIRTLLILKGFINCLYVVSLSCVLLTYLAFSALTATPGVNTARLASLMPLDPGARKNIIHVLTCTRLNFMGIFKDFVKNGDS